MTIVDTGPLVALCDRRDPKHRAALTHVDRLTAGGLAVCDATISEACLHLPHAYQRARLEAWLDALGVVSLPSEPDVTFRRDVFAWLRRYADHEPDWADGCLAVLSGRDARLKIWTYDREFRTTWRRPDGSAIPLA